MASTSKKVQHFEGNINVDKQKMTLNYEQVKKKYFDLVERNMDLLKVPICTRQEIEERIKLIQTDPSTARNFNHFVETVDGQNKLYVRISVLQSLEVLSVEDAFDILLNTHVGCNHGDVSATYDKLTETYSAPTFFAHWIVESCNVCNSSEGESHKPAETEIVERVSNNPSGRGLWRLNVISEDSFIKSSDRACFLLILKEDATNFVVLRPLYESSEELALDIFKLFTEFGYPEKVCVPNMLTFYKKIFHLVYLINPVVIVPVEQVTFDNNIFEKDKEEVLMELQNWTEMMKDAYWEQSCHIVQYKLNTTEKLFTRLFNEEKFIGIPFNQFFDYRYRTKMTWLRPPYLEIKTEPENSTCARSLPVL